MQIEIKIDEECTETKIVVVTSKVTEEVNEIVKRLSSEQPQMIAAFKDDQATMLDPTKSIGSMHRRARSMPRRKAVRFFSDCGYTRQSNALQNVPLCAYQTAKSSI